MKSSLGKLGRKLSINRSDGREKRDHQPSAHLEELAHATKDMQDMRNCYDSLLSAAAATANSIYEFAESLNEMGTCLLDKTTVDTDDESGRVLSALGNMQSELQKIADTYRSYVVVTITNPTESLLSELRKVEEMKLQCDEKREAYEYMMAQHKDKGKLKSGKGEYSVTQKLQEAQEEYNEVARLCAFRVKSLKEGQCRSLLAQAARHHAAQLNFFRKGVKVLEEVDPHVRIVAEKHRIDCQLSDGAAGEEGEGISSYESTDDGELSFDYRRNKQGLATSSNQMEVDRADVTYPQVPNVADSEINVNKYQGEQIFGRQGRVSSYSAPLYPEKTDASGKQPKETQPARKYYSHVLPPPVETKSSNSRTPPTSAFQHPLPDEKHERDTGNDNTSTSASVSASASRTTRSSTENASGSSIQLPTPLTERFSFPQHTGYDGKSAVKRQAYSGPLTPSKSFSGKMSSSAGQNVASRSVSPPTLTSPKISELHELPRPPPPSGGTSSTLSRPSGLIGHTPPLFFKNQEASSQPPNKRPILTSTAASPLPIPPLVVSRSFSIPSTHHRVITSLRESPHTGQVPSPPLTPVSLANVPTVSEAASHMAQI